MRNKKTLCIVIGFFYVEFVKLLIELGLYFINKSDKVILVGLWDSCIYKGLMGSRKIHSNIREKYIEREKKREL